MTYLVTFCVFDHTVDSNPAWHGAFILSRYNDSTKQVEVVDTWGYYGVPSTGDAQGRLAQFKKKIGLDVDLSGNHGWLKHEEVRFMDKGYGLHGYSYEITSAQFQILQQECHKRVAAQEAAVKEVLGENIFSVARSGKVRCYPGEQHSKNIYEIEKHKAKIEQREPRLHRFEFNLSLGWSGPSLQKSHTCKTEALEILETVLSPELLAPYRASAFPRFISSGMEDILLYSEGPLDMHTKSSGQRIYFRDGTKEGVKLVWTLPPQKIKALPNSNIHKLFAIDEEYCAKAKEIAGMLQQLEWFLRQALVPASYEHYKQALLERIIDCYRGFSILKPELKTPKVTGLSGFFYSLASLPKNAEQRDLQQRINKAEDLFNALYMALVSGMKIDNQLPAEPAFFTAMPAVTELQNATDDMNQTGIEVNPLEALVSYLSLADQQQLCKIIKRNYCEPDSDIQAEELNKENPTYSLDGY